MTAISFVGKCNLTAKELVILLGKLNSTKWFELWYALLISIYKLMNVRSFLKILKFRADKKEPSLKKKQINGFLNAIYVHMLSMNCTELSTHGEDGQCFWNFLSNIQLSPHSLLIITICFWKKTKSDTDFPYCHHSSRENSARIFYKCKSIFQFIF